MKIETQISKFDQSVEGFVDCVDSLHDAFFLERQNHWSSRDVVAHLTGWNRYIMEGSRQIMRGELPFYDIDPGEDYSKVNAVLVLKYSSNDRQEMLAELLVSAHELKRFIRSLDPSDWIRDYGVRHKGAVITIQNTVAELIEDYDKHAERIKEWVRRENDRKQDF